MARTKQPKQPKQGYVVNPDTGRYVKIGSATHKKMMKKGINVLPNKLEKAKNKKTLKECREFIEYMIMIYITNPTNIDPNDSATEWNFPKVSLSEYIEKFSTRLYNDFDSLHEEYNDAIEDDYGDSMLCFKVSKYLPILSSLHTILEEYTSQVYCDMFMDFLAGKKYKHD